MGEYAGELRRKFISFHRLENESDVPKGHNTEETENYPDLPQRSLVEIVVIEETETSPSKKLAVLQVTSGKKTMVEERGKVDKESFAVGSQECLLSNSDEGTEGLEKFLRDKLESLGGDGIENIAEVDPAGVLELLDSNLVDRDNTGSGMVTVENKFPRSQVDEILRAELGGKKIDVGSKRSLCKSTGRPSSGQYCPVVTRGFSCAAKCAISCIVCYEGLCLGVVCHLNGIGMRCDLSILL